MSSENGASISLDQMTDGCTFWITHLQPKWQNACVALLSNGRGDWRNAKGLVPKLDRKTRERASEEEPPSPRHSGTIKYPKCCQRKLRSFPVSRIDHTAVNVCLPLINCNRCASALTSQNLLPASPPFPRRVANTGSTEDMFSSLPRGKRWIMIFQAGPLLSAFPIPPQLTSAQLLFKYNIASHGVGISVPKVWKGPIKFPAESMQARALTAHANLCHPASLSKMTPLLHVTSSNPFPPLGRQCGKGHFSC